jgi:predicted nuclease of predicted toxin-antitoxin system
MRFLLDENLDQRLIAFLRVRGHDAMSAVEEPGAGSPDLAVLATARDSDRILLTNDTDFGELILRRRLPHAGVVLFRLQAKTLAAREAALEMLLNEYAERLRGFLVVTEGRVRIRRPVR